MNTIQVGNAPCSWGTLEFEGYDSNPIGYSQMLDELVETGYTATELGDWGFMPTQPEKLREEIIKRNLVMLGAFVQMAFRNSEISAGKAEALKTAHLLAAAFPERKAYLILADDNATDPQRTLHAGRVTDDMGLSPEEWQTFTRNVQEVARAVYGETGLPCLFHHHSAGFVETPAEIDRFLEMTDPALVNLVFDTGHYVFGAGAGAGGDVVAVLERLKERISYIHFKDCHPEIAERSRSEKWDYLKALQQGVFCELGKGCVDFKGVVDWLRRRGYEGWVLVEQDVLPGMGSPKESARRNREYLRSIGL